MKSRASKKNVSLQAGITQQTRCWPLETDLELGRSNGENKCALSQNDGDSDFVNCQQLENLSNPLPNTTPSFAESCTLYRLP